MKYFYLSKEETIENLLYDISKYVDSNFKNTNIFICGYKDMGKALANDFILLGSHVRVGTDSVEEFNQLIKQPLGIAYVSDIKYLSSMIRINEIIVNTIPNFKIADNDKAFLHIFDINDYYKKQVKRLELRKR